MTKTVLIAEDEPNIVASLEFLLRQEAYEVLVARDGEEALQLVRRHTPQLVLLDVMMPRMSGFDVCRSIRGNPACRGVKVMMLSAKGRESDITDGLAVGADAYVTKPFSTQALLARVRELLGESA